MQTYSTPTTGIPVVQNGNVPETMTSLEIAEVVNKRHDNVKRTIETLSEQGVIVRPQFEDEQSIDAMGRSRVTQVYRVGERDSYIIVAQLSPEFTARLVDYWQAHKIQRQMSPAEMFLHSAQTMYAIEQRQVAQAAEIQTIGSDVATLKQSLTALDKLPPNGELVTHLRKRVAKEFGLSFETINKVMDAPTYMLHPKFVVRNHHENAKESANAGYWKKDVNAVFRRFVSECTQVSPTQCTHPYIEGRFRLVKGEGK